MDLDKILPSVGEFGRYQKLVLAFIILPSVFPCGFNAYNQLFMASFPDHWCNIPELKGVDPSLAKNLSIPVETTLDGQSRFSQCYMYDGDYQNLTVIARQASERAKIRCKNGWTYSDGNVLNSVVSEWDLVCDKDFYVTLAFILFNSSGLIGHYIFGYIDDRFGRKPSFFIYLLILCSFGTATAFANSFVMWIIFRMGVGFTIPAIYSSPCVFVTELVGPKDRMFVSMMVSIAYSASLATLAVVAWAIQNWRWMSLATTLPFFLLFILWGMLPESPRWLLARGRYKEAEKILVKIARVNGKTIPNDFITGQNAYKPLVENKPTQKNYGRKDLFATRNLRWKTVILTFIWFIITSVYVGLSYYASILGGNEHLNFFLAAAVEFPTYIFLWFGIKKLGRRWTLCICMVVGGISCLGTVLAKNDYIIMLVLFCIGKMGIAASFVVLPLLALELYPTVVRGQGVSFSSVIGMFGLIVIPLVNYLGSNMIMLPMIIMGTVLVLGGSTALLLPETLNESLPQTIEDAEKTKLRFCVCYDLAQNEKNINKQKH